MADLDEQLEGLPIQQHGRTHNSTYSGMEIVRKFHVPKWSDFLTVQRALHGRVHKGDDGQWVRVPPTRDTYIESAYCNETQVDFAHPNAPKTMPSLSGDTIREQLEKQKEELQVGTAGAVVTAHYRPLITAWRPAKSNKPDEDEEPLSAKNAQRIWDWIDPVFTPGVMQMPWPAGLHAVVDQEGLLKPFKSRDIGTESSSPLGVAVSDVSFKRLLCGEVPWDPIAQLGEVINKDEWPVAGSPVARGLGFTFPERTLKFINADVANMIDADGVRWYEIILNFKWIQHSSHARYDNLGKRVPGWVTWDHQFMRPNGLGLGWYEIFRNGTINLFGFNITGLLPGQQQFLQEGNLHTHGNFDNLFALNQPKNP